MRQLAYAGWLLGLLGVPACVGTEEFTVCKVDAGIYRGRPPRAPSDFKQLRATGVRTILDMQSFRPQACEQERSLAAEHGISYRNCPVSPLPGSTAEIESAYRCLLCKEDYPVYIHCYTSKDRTSLLVGLYRVRCQGWQPQTAYDEMVRAGMHDVLGYFPRYFWDNTRGPGTPAGN
jgi:protein tyrosine phosphatase (PTP) superfamily phosphohydrolase (DUF442 family)